MRFYGKITCSAGALDSANGSSSLASHAINIAPAGSPPSQDDSKGCTCKASKCLKLYCVCFAANQPCGKECACRNCHNNGLYPEEKQAAVEAILERNPAAFQPKVSTDAKHSKGCSCRKSGCLKRYCECFNAGVLCSDLCKCIACKNFEGSADLASTLHAGGGVSGPAHSQHSTAPNSYGGASLAGSLKKPSVMDPSSGFDDSDKHGKQTLLLQYGKRSLSQHESFLQQPQAKRVLFQRGPALRSTFGEIGAPGGLHYRTTVVEDDRPENMRDAASKALSADIVSAAERETIALLAMFAEKAAGMSTQSAGNREDNSVRTRGRKGGPVPVSAGNTMNSKYARSRNSTRGGVGLADLYCEESGIVGDEDETRGQDEYVESVRKRPSFPRDADDDLTEEEDNEGGDDDFATTNPSDSSAGQSDVTGPRPYWYAAAERAALEHCADVLRRIANSSATSVDNSAYARAQAAPASASRQYEHSYSQSIPEARISLTPTESRPVFARSGTESPA